MKLTLRAASEDKARRASFYLFGRGAFHRGPEGASLAGLIGLHAGVAERPAYIGHLGAGSLPLRLGAAPALGTSEKQVARLAAFLDQAAEDLGAYGSWWTESITIIRRTLDVVLPAFPVDIVLLQDVAAREPLEWAGTEVEAWIAARRARWGALEDCLLIVGRDSTLAPFVNSAFSRTLSLEDWLAIRPAQETGSAAAARVEISHRNGKELPKHLILAATAKTVLSLPDQCIIDVYRPGTTWPPEFEVAEFDGFDLDQLVIKVSWRPA